MTDFVKPTIFISRCLEIEKCRFDGSVIQNEIVRELMPYIHVVHDCPEMGIGLPSPREALRIIDQKGKTALVTSRTGVDQTAAMDKYCTQLEAQLEPLNLDGFVLKSRSPSCGIKEVKVYATIGKAPCVNKQGKGIFADRMMRQFEDCIFEDEGRLSNFAIREHFYTRIFTLAEFKQVMKTGQFKDLVAFHSKHKYLFMAYSQTQLKALGKLVANHEKRKFDVVCSDYKDHLNLLFEKKPKKGQYVNEMLHIFGYFSEQLTVQEKAHFLDLLESYRRGFVPHMLVMTLLKSWVIRFEITYLMMQSVFEPFPKSLIQLSDSGKVK